MEINGDSGDQQQKANFYQQLDAHIQKLNMNNRETFCLPQNKYNKVLRVLSLDEKEACPEGPKFKHWAKKLYKLGMVGSQNIIFCKKSGCPVVAREEIFQTISTCHTNVGHSGRDKTWAEVKSNYAGIKWDVIDIFLKTCTSCCQRQAVKSLPSGKAMINLSFLLRVQIDLIDFRSRPDNEYKWILHARDCFSKYSWAYALKSKRAAEVASHLFDQFCSFGPPRILQSDNGR